MHGQQIAYRLELVFKDVYLCWGKLWGEVL